MNKISGLRMRRVNVKSIS